MSTPEPVYAETRALLMVLEALEAAGEDDKPDYREAGAYLHDAFLPGELRRFAVAANELQALIWQVYSEKATPL